MRMSAALLLVGLVVGLGSGSGPETPAIAAGQEPPFQVSWPDAPPLATPFPAPDPTPPPLPEPSIDEPFAIGEALYDPGRAEQAVMSLLARMRIGVASSPASAKSLTLDESEVRTLIALAEDDLRSSDDIENLPFGFEDLHRAVSGLLPQLTIETLAETYTRVYAEQPDGLVAKVMMGQPLEPETRLTRAQIWVLLMDGFAGAGGADAAYGAADRELPDLPSPNPAWSAAEWREALARLPLVAASSLVAVEQTTGGTTLRRVAQAAPLLSRVTGKPLVGTRTGSLAGQEVTWEVAEDSPLRELGTVGTATGQPTAVAANGTTTFAFKPSAPSAGPGEIVQEWSSVAATFPACPLVASAYTVPQPMCGFILGPRRLDAPLAYSWRTTEKLRVKIVYRYALELQTPIGGVKREGVDEADGWVVRRPNGSYAGTMEGRVHAFQQVRGSQYCGKTLFRGRQQLHVEGRMLPAGAEPGTGSRGGMLARTRTLSLYSWGTPAPGSGPAPGFTPSATWLQQPPEDGYLVLEFFPKTAPATFGGRTLAVLPNNPIDCLPLLPAQETQRGRGASYFLPFNDAQWTTPSAGYAIGLRRSRDYYFEDHNNSVGYIGNVELDFSFNSGSGTGRPRWTVRVQRPSLAP